MSARGDPSGFNHLQSLLGHPPSGTRHVFDGVYGLPNYKCSAPSTIRAHNLSGLRIGAGQQPVPTGDRPSSPPMALQSSTSMDRIREFESSVFNASRSVERLHENLPTMVHSVLPQQLPALLHDSFPQYFPQQPPQPVSPSTMAQSPNQSQPAPAPSYNNPAPAPPPQPPPDLFLTSPRSPPAHLIPPPNPPHQDPYDAIRALDESFRSKGPFSSDQRKFGHPPATVQGESTPQATDLPVGTYDYGDPRYELTRMNPIAIDTFVRSIRPYHVSENPESWVTDVEREAKRLCIHKSLLLQHVSAFFLSSACESVKMWWKRMHTVISPLTTGNTSADLIWSTIRTALITDFDHCMAIGSTQAGPCTPFYAKHMHDAYLQHQYRPPPPPDQLLIPHQNYDSCMYVPTLNIDPPVSPLLQSTLSFAHPSENSPNNFISYDSSPTKLINTTATSIISESPIIPNLTSTNNTLNSSIDSNNWHSTYAHHRFITPALLAVSHHETALRSQVYTFSENSAEQLNPLSHVPPCPYDNPGLLEISKLSANPVSMNSSFFSSSSNLLDMQSQADDPMPSSLQIPFHIPPNSPTVPTSQSPPPLIPNHRLETLPEVQGLSMPQPNCSPDQDTSDNPGHELNPMDSKVETAPAIAVNSPTVHNNWPSNQNHSTIMFSSSSAVASSPENNLWSPLPDKPIASPKHASNAQFYGSPCNNDGKTLIEFSAISSPNVSTHSSSSFSSFDPHDMQILADHPISPSILNSTVPLHSTTVPKSLSSSVIVTLVPLPKANIDSLHTFSGDTCVTADTAQGLSTDS